MATADDVRKEALRSSFGSEALGNPNDRMRFFGAAASAAESKQDFARALAFERQRRAIFETITCQGARARMQTLRIQYDLSKLELERDLARLGERRASAERERYRDEAYRDSLTGLHNRRYLEERVAVRLMDDSHRGLVSSVLLIDIDHFKRINDRYGHPFGDKTLTALATCLRNGLRREDELCRIGGEEFLIVLPGSGLPNAMERAHRLLAAFQTTCITDGSNTVTGLTFSAGVTDTTRHGSELKVLLDATDIALYAAKAQGRARINC